METFYTNLKNEFSKSEQTFEKGFNSSQTRLMCAFVYQTFFSVINKIHFFGVHSTKAVLKIFSFFFGTNFVEKTKKKTSFRIFLMFLQSLWQWWCFFCKFSFFEDLLLRLPVKLTDKKYMLFDMFPLFQLVWSE